LFLITFLVSVLYIGFSLFFGYWWATDLSTVFAVPTAWFIVVFIAVVPGFVYMFYLSSLAMGRVKKHEAPEVLPPVSVIVPAYNAEGQIGETLESILSQEYPGEIRILVANDGSTDKTAEEVKRLQKDHPNIEMLSLPQRGKSHALNAALRHVETTYFITVDSDTILHRQAILHIVSAIVRKEYAAVAGALLPKNHDSSFVTRMQVWDYSLGIYATKLVQSFYRSTMVAQGAFSIYKTAVILELGGFADSIGEDIVLTWGLLKAGYKTSFERRALAFTDVPENFKTLIKQRKRWARGMIESFKRNKGIVKSKKIASATRCMLIVNMLFPLIDFAFSVFIPLGIVLALWGNFLIVGKLTLLLLPMTILLCVLIDRRLKSALKHIGCKECGVSENQAMCAGGACLPRRSILAFFGYILVYPFVLAPNCVIAYLQEILYEEKKW